MKLSKIISQIALGETYNEKALLKCLSMKLILRNEYFDVLQRYLAGNTREMRPAATTSEVRSPLLATHMRRAQFRR